MLAVRSAVLIIILFICGTASPRKAPKPYKFKKPSLEYNNPNFVRDRYIDEVHLPELPPVIFEKQKKPFHPAWMDYCDPYHCNDYYRRACGANWKKKKFRIFQSVCHMIISNQCSTYRGTITYRPTDLQFCEQFIMFPRQGGCPSSCPDDVEPVCARSNLDQHLVLFRNQCLLEKRNCDPGQMEDEYDEVDAALCKQSLDAILQ